MMRIRLAITLVVLTLFAAACAAPGGVSDDGEAAATETSDTAAGDTNTASATTSTEAGAVESEGAKEPDSSSATGADTTTSSEAGQVSETGESKQTEESGQTTSTTRPTKEPERVPDDTTPPVTGETPADLLAQIIADAADRAGVPDSDIIVIRDEFVIWNDGSLGCAQPGEVYTQALVDGYWVVLEAAGTEYDYRASSDGYWFLCEGAGLQPRPPSG